MKVLLMYPPSPSHLAELQLAAGRAEFLVADNESLARSLIEEAEVVLGNRYFVQSLPYARNLKWMQSNSMGVDLILSRGGERLRGVTVTCARGLYADEIADHAMALLLGVVRGIHTSRDDQHAGRWSRRPLPGLHGKTAMILGWGCVGRAIAARLIPFGARVLGARLSTAADKAPDQTHCLICGPSAWREKLPSVDYLILALPSTCHTRHLVGADELSRLSPGAVVVNVGRGATLDEQALFAALRRGDLSGAGLDVLIDEPPPADHPVWSEPGVLFTPHVARSPETPPFRWESLFVANLARYAQGRPLLHVVNQDAGY
jgi:phosphoglycerate dehydrogenase-like enzyme